jgi:hypothetical protein
MAAQVLFLSEQTLKQRSVLQENVDMKIVTPTIIEVQEFYILPILGTSLYNELKTQIAANTVSVANKNLIDNYITNTMIWYMQVELPLSMNYKYFNKSVGVQNADNMQPANMSEIRDLMDEARNKAQVYAERLTKFLLQNTKIYPLYLTQTGVGIDTIFPQRTNYNSGLVLGGDGCCMGNYNFRGIKIEPRELTQPCTFC